MKHQASFATELAGRPSQAFIPPEWATDLALSQQGAGREADVAGKASAPVEAVRRT